MSEAGFSHLVEIDEASGCLTIYRVFADGKRHLYTTVPLPPRIDDADSSAYEAFARTLGENILLDSPAARKLIGL